MDGSEEELSLLVCAGESAQVEIQVLEAAGLEAVLTQTVTEALSFARTAHESV